MVGFVSFVALAIALAAPATAFPAHLSLAGLTREQVADAMTGFGTYSRPPPPPGPLEFSGTKLINDAAHPFVPPGPNDIRGPCPALNTLANHGYISHNGIDSPSNIVHAAMEGFNMANALAKFTCYAAFIVNGNMVTDLLSIGQKSDQTGPDPPKPAIVGGLNTHNVFEGDSSMTRADFYDGGDVASFNETLFQGFIEFSNRFGAGRYNLTVAGEYRYKRTMDGIMNNPTFTIAAPRIFSAYSEAVNPINLWVDGRQDDGQLRLDVARSFFEAARFPEDFHRAARPMSADNEAVVLAAHPFEPGGNVGAVNTYTVDANAPRLPDRCSIYEHHVNRTLRALYPNPTGDLLDAIRANAHYFFTSVEDNGCSEIFPYGRFEDADNNLFRSAALLPILPEILTPSEPAVSMSAASMPATSMPAASMPAASMPAASMPAASMPAVSMPAASMPAASIPAPSMTEDCDTATSAATPTMSGASEDCDTYTMPAASAPAATMSEDCDPTPTMSEECDSTPTMTEDCDPTPSMPAESAPAPSMPAESTPVPTTSAAPEPPTEVPSSPTSAPAEPPTEVPSSPTSAPAEPPTEVPSSPTSAPAEPPTEVPSMPTSSAPVASEPAPSMPAESAPVPTASAPAEPPTEVPSMPTSSASVPSAPAPSTSAAAAPTTEGPSGLQPTGTGTLVPVGPPLSSTAA